MRLRKRDRECVCVCVCVCSKVYENMQSYDTTFAI